MRTLWMAALVLAGLATPAWADPQKLPTPQPTALRAAPEDATVPVHPALWVVKDHDSTIYLFGTIHLLKPGIRFLDGPLAKALDSSGELVTEVSDPSGTDVQKALLARATLPEGQTLRGLMTDKQRADYEALLARIPLQPALLEKYKPWYAAVVLSSLPLMKAGLNPRAGAEAAISASTDARHVPHSALETADYQLGLFDGLPTELQLTFLASVMRDYDKIGPEIDKLILAWGKGDADTLAALMNAEMDDPRLEEVLLVQRNRNWAKWVRERLHKPGTVFVAVGAGHLAGKDSVQAQLAAAGIAATRVQ